MTFLSQQALQSQFETFLENEPPARDKLKHDDWNRAVDEVQNQLEAVKIAREEDAREEDRYELETEHSRQLVLGDNT